MFQKITNQNLIQSLRQNLLIKSFPIIKDFQCISKCSQSSLCTIAIIDSSICSMYIKNDLNGLNVIYSPTSTIYIKTSYHINQYLIHYWSFNRNYLNHIANTNLNQTNGLNYALVTDRFGRSNSSLYLNYGLIQAPNGNYIYGDFTLTVWVKIYSLDSMRRFFTLSTQTGGNIFFCLTSSGSTGPYYGNLNGNQAGNVSLNSSKWQHLAYTIKASTLSIYLDGILIYNGPTTPVSFEINFNVYFGFKTAVNLPRAELDDFKIFSRSLTQSEIIESSLNNL